MQKLLRCAVALACASSLVPSLANAQSGIPLERVAQRTGLHYAWLGAQRAVQLSGNGLVIVLRPGQQLYDVNDRVETTDQAPVYENNDLVVSRGLAAHIARLAAAQSVYSIDRPAAPSAPVNGAISFSAQSLAGAEAVLVKGTAPGGVPVRVTLLATFSEDVPTIVVSRHDLQSDASGNFQAVVPIAADFVRGSVLKIVATSFPSITAASAQVIVGSPNSSLSTAVDKVTGGIW